uniref:DUF5641 domain-containing protein n=1 Tax=Trichuris muris TaxID=70415 RepID=A0A5S6Q5N9_TRIMR
MREYLPTLQRRAKWWTDTFNLKVGDFMAVIEPNVNRGEWITGRVMRVIVSPDGIVRKAIVKTRLELYERPVTRLALLEECKSDGTEQSTRAECRGRADEGSLGCNTSHERQRYAHST